MEIREKRPQQNIIDYLMRNYKMRYSSDKRGFWLIVKHQGQKYFGFIEESILGKAINDNQTSTTLLKVVENISEKIKRKQEEKG
ncbi:hypothetical protein [endosymbiont GvMRE of Glomus versiforme]|uniref:hypothetical protein n=1 Tax=endosymbiont GvMRE of Glomus versiforme TaxID=2039283 RepID=UPI000EE720F8|nr:hypothetical protein [endosymbiont GvMRE of Glomus versiforme]RHZ35778.1 hypothetical protein GvMRE_Ic5g54 [endosymbiont GvMRE of Glomus versiforme]